MEFEHVSVLPQEVIAGLNIKPDGTYVDCTLGGAGHASRIAEKLNENGHLIGIDQDDDAIEVASSRLKPYKCKIDIVHSNFKNLEQVLKDLQIEFVDGFLFDLGVSSYQLDEADRGFSYMHDAPLDMRMDKAGKFSAYDVVNGYDEEKLNYIFKTYGEERWSKRIAQFIVEYRRENPIETTGQLVDIIRRAIPAAVRKKATGHPAKRIFQAIRIEVNNELGILEDTFRTAVSHLNCGGRIAVITFHSLEDRITKNVFKEMARGCICPPQLPVCVCHHKAQIKLCGKAIKPSNEEMEENSRSKSAKLRIAEKL
ncbi:16S rRNA (cytosine(1402)-N(4))-methyltransferase RsmH [Megamonas hypermegale]|uniref:16S rRNA (cytosine(1402)-N(4))-methyltransferase RsmH n=1 Tax=Megamonas hypermegale TaxID=158847 RepID=UPI0026EB259B|nr:16S rRNA (cytosine(1402)-N(4))-methyltransferase RsmH [Megamonas hypermegale]